MEHNKFYAGVPLKLCHIKRSLR